MGKRSAVAVLATAPALVLAAGALAGGGASIRVPVEWELSGANCSQLEPDMTIEGIGTGSFFMTSDGNLHAVVSGTATDGGGCFWRWNYGQNARPLGDGAYEVYDHFNLVGSGSPIKLHTHFVIALRAATSRTPTCSTSSRYTGIQSFATRSSG